jgi:hypothetical protein
VLKKYDEEIEGREEGGFRLGGPSTSSSKKVNGEKKAKKEDANEEKERVKLTMDYTSMFLPHFRCWHI